MSEYDFVSKIKMDEIHIKEDNTVVCMHLTFLPSQQKIDFFLGGGKISCQKIILAQKNILAPFFTLASNIYYKIIRKYFLIVKLNYI